MQTNMLAGVKPHNFRSLGRDLRPPGVYPAVDEPQTGALEAVDTHVAGFIGVTSRGPLHTAVRVGSWNEFIEIYGATSPSVGFSRSAQGYLARAVEGFFQNGGKTCYVVRVAHRAKLNQPAGAEDATCASWNALDVWGKPTFTVSALNEGKWGNNIFARFAPSTGAKTLLTLDVEVGTGEARVASSKGFEKGALVRIFDRNNSDYVVLTDVGDRVLRWGSETPLIRSYRAGGPAYLEVIDFELHVSLRDRREVFRHLQMSPLSRRYAPRVVNSESVLVQLNDVMSASALPNNLPQETQPQKLAGGTDGLNVLTPEDFIGEDLGPGSRTGLWALAGEEAVGLLVAPDLQLLTVQKPGPEGEKEAHAVQDVMVNICELLEDRFAILDAPNVRDVEVVRKWRRQWDSSYAALYYPWIQVRTEGDALITLPPSGHIAGLYARCDIEQGVHKAPGNEVVESALSLTMNLNEEHLGILNAEGINSLRSFAGRGIRTWGARTLASDADWEYINVRRLFVMLRRTLEIGTQWVVFEPNEAKTWEKVSGLIGDFLGKLWKQGSFTGDTPSDAFFVKCDEETNTAETQDLGQMVIEIGIAPSIPTEYLIFRVTQKMGNETSQE